MLSSKIIKRQNSLFANFIAIPFLLFLMACNSGNEGKSVTLSNKAPSIQVTAPDSEENQQELEPITFTASASDNEDGDLSDDILWSSSVDGILGSGSQISVLLNPGIHTVTAAVADSKNQISTDEVNVTVIASIDPNTPPAVSIDSPISGGIQSEQDSTILAASASDNEDGDISSRVHWVSSLDGELGNGAELTVQLNSGIHLITATVDDSEGMSAETVINYQVIDTSDPDNEPSINIISPISGASQLEQIEVALTAVAIDDEDGDISGNIEWVSNIDGNLGTGNRVMTILSIGSHIITASIVDSADQTTSISISYTIEFNNPPLVNIIAPIGGGSVSEVSLISFNANAVDSEDGNISANVHWSSNIVGNLGTGSNISVRLPPGNHIITASVSDIGSKTSSSMINLSVRPNVPPSVNILSPDEGGSQTQGELTTLRATATDSEDGVISSSISWRSSREGYLGRGSEISVVLSSGDHVLTARITDSANSSSSMEINYSVLENIAPLIEITSPENDGEQNDANSVVFSGNASDNLDGDLSENILWTSDLDGDLGEGASVVSILSVGNHVITATVTDSDDVTTMETINYRIRSINAPTLSITSPLNGGSQTDLELTTFTAAAADIVDGDLSADITWSSDIDGNLGTGAEITFQLSIGVHVITAQITDSDAMTDSRQISYEVISDIAPTIEITSPTDGGSQSDQATTTLIASAEDQIDGDVSDNIEWISDLDGVLGTGREITLQLSTGLHTITATVIDSLGQSSSDDILFNLTSANGVATLNWVAPTENTDDSQLTDLSGFKIYYGTIENNLDNSVTIASADTLSYMFSNLLGGQTYYFAVIAYNDSGVESELSSTASKFIPL